MFQLRSTMLMVQLNYLTLLFTLQLEVDDVYVWIRVSQWNIINYFIVSYTNVWLFFLLLQFPGCQQACQFHLEKITQRAPVQVITHGEEVITLTGNTASWPRPDAAASDVVGPFVYVVMRRLPGKAWKQITQTLDLSTRIPAGPTAGTLRVLVVNKDGLVTIYSPIVKSGLSGAEAIIRSLGKDGIFGLGFPLTNAAGSAGPGKRINTEIMSVTTVDPLSMLVWKLYTLRVCCACLDFPLKYKQ